MPNCKPVKTAVIGCGAISDIYLTNMQRLFSTTEVVACAANHLESAEKKAAQYGIRAADVDGLIADPEVEMVVVLTPAPSHYELIKKALLAGKHVYTEKTMAVSLRQAKELASLADEKGLYLGSAPDTFMGSAWQTARKAMDEGLLGDVTSFHIVANRDLTMLASLFKFLRQPGGGICYDYGVYYLTALCSLVGPVSQVYAQIGNHARVRKNIIPTSPGFGQDYIYDNEAQVNAVLTTESGVVGTFSLNGDSAIQDQAYFTIHGTKGILRLGDANQFGSDVSFLPNNPLKAEWQTLAPVTTLSDNCRGIGPANMAACIRRQEAHLASKEMACHVLDVIEKMMESAKKGAPLRTETTCARPAPFAGWKELLVHEPSDC